MMKNFCNKRGSGQFEMVISFVFFMGFVLFLFIFLTPEDTTTLSGAVISEFHDTFELKASTNLSRLSLRTDSEVAPCFSISLPENLFKYNVNNGETRVVLLNGNLVDSGINGLNLNLNNDDNYFKVAISPEFEDSNLIGCQEIVDYTLGGIVERQVISYSALENMRDEYYSDYNGLRNKLKIPSIYDFSIIVENMPEVNMKPNTEVPSSVEIMAKDYIFEVLKNDGTYENQKFNFRIW